jgi:hypothetical protein
VNPLQRQHFAAIAGDDQKIGLENAKQLGSLVLHRSAQLLEDWALALELGLVGLNSCFERGVFRGND